MKIGRYSIGVGDRFGRECSAQLAAIEMARRAGVEVTPVWNKSFREHSIIGTVPGDARNAADRAVRASGCKSAYFVDADHINLKNVSGFLDASDFFTIDVADFTGKAAGKSDTEKFADRFSFLSGSLQIPGIPSKFEVSREKIIGIAGKYLLAVREAGKIYRVIESARGAGNFITEVSMDETDVPQSPLDMLFILAAVAEEKIPAQTIAPRFSGRFNKGVDYVGDLAAFEMEFDRDLAVVAFAAKEFGLPENLKLSVHSGSDKFSIYGIIRNAIRRREAGVHLKTAGTTWLEEVIGLAESGGCCLKLAGRIYAGAYSRFDELCGPYASVINIRKNKLPSPSEVAKWDSAKFARTLRHDQACPDFNPDFRQLVHVGYKVAAEMGEEFLSALDEARAAVERNVTENLYSRHLKPLFLD